MRALLLCLLLPWALPAFAQSPAPLPSSLALETINPSTNLPGVVGVRHAGDGSDRLFAIVRTGSIRVFDANRTLLPTPYLSFATDPPPMGFTNVAAEGGDERGLLGLAFHPLYAANGKVYVYYLDADSNSVVTEYTVSGSDANRVEPASARVILRVYQPYTNHNGGDIHFGADGYLYIGLGDGGSGNDPCNSGQSLTSAAMSNSSGCVADATFTATPPAGIPRGQATSRALLGKMLRIDVDGTETPAGADLCGADPAVRRYGIPADNPFAGDAGGNADACDETYHYGLRNPFRFSFDRQTHDLIIGDVGQSTVEEVDLVGPEGGHNFGWKLCEGFHARGSTTVDCPLATATDPILEYGRSFGVSITGGFRYRGPYHALDGVLFFADAYGRRIFFAREGRGDWDWAVWGDNAGTVVGFGEDEAGQLYLTTLAGQVRRFVLGADVVLRKTAELTTDEGTPGVADAGDVITFAVTVLNGGGAVLDGIVVQDVMGDAPARVLDCADTLEIGDSTTCETYTHVVSQADIDAGTALSNVASVLAFDPDGGTVTASAETRTSVAAAAPALGLLVDTTLADGNGNGIADLGDTVNYAYYVANTGNVTLHGIAVESTQAGALDCGSDPLGVGVSADCATSTRTVQQADIDAGLLRNTVAASALAPDGATVGETVQVDTPVTAAVAELALAVTASLAADADGDGRVDVGDTLRYAYTATNTGTVTLDTLRVTATRHADAACTPATLTPQAEATCTADVVVAAADVAGGVVRNEATARGVDPAEQAVVSEAEVVEVDADRPAAVFADGFEDG